MAFPCHANGQHRLTGFQPMMAGVLKRRGGWPRLVGVTLKTLQESLFPIPCRQRPGDATNDRSDVRRPFSDRRRDNSFAGSRSWTQMGITLFFAQLSVGFGLPVQIGIQKALDLAIQHFVKVAHAETGAGIFNALIGMQESNFEFANRNQLEPCFGNFRLLRLRVLCLRHEPIGLATFSRLAPGFCVGCAGFDIARRSRSANASIEWRYRFC